MKRWHIALALIGTVACIGIVHSSLPTVRVQKHTSTQAHITLQQSWWTPTHYRIAANQCIQQIEIQNTILPIKTPCRPHGVTLALGPLLQNDTNTLTITFSKPIKAPLVSVRPLPVLPLGVLCMAVTLFLTACIRRRHILGSLIGVIGAVYLVHNASFDFLTLAYDSAGHLEYIEYLAAHKKIPPAQGGWEFFQPPLYYTLLAPWLHLRSLAEVAIETIAQELQLSSLLLLLGSLLLTTSIFRKVFDAKQSLVLIGVSTASLLPAVIFYASRISNDVLLLPLILLGFLCTLHYWETPLYRHCMYIAACIGIALLAKSTAAILLPVAIGVILVNRKTTIRNKGEHLLLVLSGIGIIAGWLFVYRFGIEGETHVVGNTLHPDLFVGNSLHSFITLNPLSILKAPLNTPWLDGYGREYFWEFFFKSAFVGEWNLGTHVLPIAQALLATGLVLTLGIIGGLVGSIRKRAPYDIPFALLLFSSIAALLTHRISLPFASNQDIRFIPFVGVAFAYFLCRFIESRKQSHKEILMGVVAAFVVLCVVLDVTLVWF